MARSVKPKGIPVEAQSLKCLSFHQELVSEGRLSAHAMVLSIHRLAKACLVAAVLQGSWAVATDTVPLCEESELTA